MVPLEVRNGGDSRMTDVTRILNAIERGNAKATDELLPLVYEELRLLAAQKLSHEPPGQTLQATALVHEAYIRLVGEEAQSWQNSRHFFVAAAEAMRRILVENARRKKTLRRGGDKDRVDIDLVDLPVEICVALDDLLALDEALTRLAEADPAVANVVKLHCFAGLPLVSVAEITGLSTRTAERYWAFGKTWLYQEISGEGEPPVS
jgi:RNA polymerase sigma factor (TIGR02999 family)